MSKLNLFFCFFISFISLQSLAETDKPEQIIFIKSLSTQENGSHNCTIGQDQVIWMGTSDHLFVNSNNKADNPLLVEGIKQTHIKNIFWRLNKYWVTSHNGLYYINPDKLTVAKRIEGLQNKIIVDFYPLKNNDLIAQDSRNKVYYIDSKTDKAVPYDLIEKNNISKVIIQDNHIWLLADQSGGLFYIDKNNNPDIAHEINTFKDKIVSDISIIDSRIYFSTLNDGLYLAHNSQDLDNITQVSELKGLGINNVIQFSNYLLIGTVKNGLFTINLKESGSAQSVKDLEGESISHIILSKEKAWIYGDFEGQLLKVENINDNLFFNLIKPLPSEKVLDILLFDEKLWLRIGYDRLLSLDENDLNIKYEEYTLLKGRTISKLKLIGSNLFFIETQKGAFVAKEKQKPQAIEGLENQKINAIYTKFGLIWTETYNHDIFVMESNKPEIAYPLAEMKGVNIWSISKVSDNQFLIGSNKGAFSLIKNNDNFQASLIPGTQNESTTSVLLVCNNLWIGTLNGYKKITHM